MPENPLKEFLSVVKRRDNLLPITFLFILYKNPCYGYEMTKMIYEQTGIKLSRGSVYPTLYFLERRGYITGEQSTRNGRTRKTYMITERGGKLIKDIRQTYNALLGSG